MPGLLPDNLASYSATSPDTVVLHLKSAVSSIWFTYNQLAEITPMPAAWDVTSAGATAGSGGCAAATGAAVKTKCAAVYKFMSAQAANAKQLLCNAHWFRGYCLLQLGDIPATDAAFEAHARVAEELQYPLYLYLAIAFRAMRASTQVLAATWRRSTACMRSATRSTA